MAIPVLIQRILSLRCLSDFFAGKVDLTGMKSRQNVNVTISRDVS